MKPVLTLFLSLCAAMAASAQAADRMQSDDPSQAVRQPSMQDRERIYGSELMTPQERAEYHNRMRAMKTEQEREAFRQEHHKQMQERARAQGKTLPDTPPAGREPGMGPGMGPGGGMMGPGGGMMGPGGGMMGPGGGMMGPGYDRR